MRSIDVRQAPQTINKMSMRETPTTRRKKRRKMTDGIQIKMARNQRKQQKFLHKMLTFAMLIVLVKTTHQISLPVAASAPQKAPFAGLLGGTNLPDSGEYFAVWRCKTREHFKRPRELNLLGVRLLL